MIDWNQYNIWTIIEECRKLGIIRAPRTKRGALVQRLEEAINNAKFTVFPKLPIEIRMMIWKMALPQDRRVVYVGWDDMSYNYGPIAIRDIMLASKESLEVVCDRYRPNYKIGSSIEKFSYRDDVFYFSYLSETLDSAASLNRPIMFNLIQTLWLYPDEFQALGEPEERLEVFAKLPNLKTLIIATYESYEREHRLKWQQRTDTSEGGI